MKNFVKTRFAPSPTGLIHLGNIRCALYSWAFARHNNGIFILRIEDTDILRSTKESISSIFECMNWLGLDYDEGPYYQTNRIDRYNSVINELIKKDFVYPCYMSEEELIKLRNNQKMTGIKPRYDRTWRPEIGKILPNKPYGVKPVLRFKNPLTGKVEWKDKIKGKISIYNSELDDLIIARSDGMPTYNFCVVVDDIDMNITDVIRGEEHINNTPRQINIFHALNYSPPNYAHLPNLLDKNGKKMSKRNSAINVMKYRDDGYLPEALINYLSRLGYTSGNIEIFSKEDFVRLFNLNNLGKSPAKYDHNKLNWLNNYYIKNINNNRLSNLTKYFLKSYYDINDKIINSGPCLSNVVNLFKDRSSTIKDIAKYSSIFYKYHKLDYKIINEYLKYPVRDAIIYLIKILENTEWIQEKILEKFKKTIFKYNLDMHQLTTPIRLIIFGIKHTPSIDKTLFVFDKYIIINRLKKYIEDV